MRACLLCISLLVASCATRNSPASPPPPPPADPAQAPPADPAPPPAADPVHSPPAAERVPAVESGQALYGRVEGTGFRNACQGDAECRASGCSGEVCAAEEVTSTCEARAWPQRGAACGCVSGECIWYRQRGKGAKGGDPPKKGGGKGEAQAPAAGQGLPCPDGRCAAGLTCMKYYGIAGPQGPAFTSCEIPCGGKGARCPQGQSCTAIADGPGQVCR